MKESFSCDRCPLRGICETPCPPVEALLPSADHGVMDSLRRRGALFAARRLHDRICETRFLIEHRDVLTGRLRIVFDLTYKDGLSQREIALRLGVHRHSVGHWLRQALDLGQRHGRRPAFTELGAGQTW